MAVLEELVVFHAMMLRAATVSAANLEHIIDPDDITARQRR
ncbi:hypothetical protein [Skermania sp. ID1734]|nr:hypothetical protein [Skermania sp. ID1734]